MDFLISNQHINPFILIGLGFLIGVMGGFFGVGGSFLAGPALFAIGLPMNMVVGTDLAHLVGKSIVATRKHRVLGNVDMKLGLFMAAGTLGGVEIGAQAIEYLKRSEQVNQVVGVFFLVVLLSISGFMGWESWKTIRSAQGKRKSAKGDRSVLAHIGKGVQRIKLRPIISLPVSGIRISIWPIILVAFIGGIFSGFLGGGAGYIRMPSLVYILGVPTHVAVGTDVMKQAPPP